MLSKKDNKDLENYTKSIREVGPYLGLGLQLAATVVIMVLIGYWIDNKTGSTPLYTIIFSVVGVFAGMYNFIKTVMSSEKESGKNNKK